MTTVFVCDVDESCGLEEAFEVTYALEFHRELYQLLNLMLVSEQFPDEEYNIRYSIARLSERILRNQEWLEENEFDEQANRIEGNE